MKEKNEFNFKVGFSKNKFEASLSIYFCAKIANKSPDLRSKGKIK